MEITTKTHKTARTVAQKTKLLPVVIPAIGINGSEWISEAKSALEEYGLKLEGHIGGPLFRPPGSSGEPHCKRGITSAEVTRFLRLMLEEEASIQKDTRVNGRLGFWRRWWSPPPSVSDTLLLVLSQADL